MAYIKLLTIASLILALSTFYSSCSKSNSRMSFTNEDLLKNRLWKCYEYYHNDKADGSVVGQQPSFEFRSDNKMYFAQILPVYRDTFQFEFLDNDNLKLTKPSVSATSIITLKIANLDSTHFDFILSNNENSNIDRYKTLKQ